MSQAPSATDPDGFEQHPFTLPAGATEVILVRHGASAHFIPGTPFPLLDGRSDPELSVVGRAQAELLAKRLRGEIFSRLYVTSLRRTQETAAPIVATAGVDFTIVAELVEVGLGDWEGGELRARTALGDPVALQIFAEERWDVIPGAESLEAFGVRLRAGIARIVDETGPDAIAVAILHGAAIGELCRHATGSRPFAFVHADNGSMSRLIVYPDDRWLLRSFNDTSHLHTP